MCAFISAIIGTHQPPIAGEDLGMQVSDASSSEAESESSDDNIFKPNIGRIEYCPITNDSIVELCHVESHQIVYVRPVVYDDEFECLLKKLNKKSTHSELLPTIKLNIDDVVLYQRFGEYYRAVVTEIPDAKNETLLQLIDFGTIVHAKSHEMRYLYTYFTP